MPLPLVSVVMPVRNYAAFVRSAVVSILHQDFKDIELILIDNASVDDTVGALRNIRDPRLRILRNEQDIGLAQSLNKAFSEASGRYIVRLDGDDRACRGRLRKQVAFMEAHSDVAAAGSAARFFGREPWVRVSPPVDPDVVGAFMLFDNPLMHPTVILRRAAVQKHGLAYRPEYTKSEDFDLWERLARVALVDNMPEVLAHLRVHRSNITMSPGPEMKDQTMEILRRGLEELGLEPSGESLAFHHRVGHGLRMASLDELERAQQWLEQLDAINAARGRHPVNAFRKATALVWFRLCRASCPIGRAAWTAWSRSSWRTYHRPHPEEVAWFAAGILRHV